MKVKEVMTSDVETCSPDQNLAAAAMVMWRQDCGVVPVVDNERRVKGVLTDRDICIATATRHVAPDTLRVAEVQTGQPRTIRPDDDIRNALEVMRTERVRRLPVVDEQGQLQGMLSINDLILQAKPSAASRSTGSARAGTTSNISATDVLEALQSICSHTVEHARAMA